MPLNDSSNVRTHDLPAAAGAGTPASVVCGGGLPIVVLVVDVLVDVDEVEESVGPAGLEGFAVVDVVEAVAAAAHFAVT